MEKDVLVLNALLAKNLLNMGFTIVNIGQNEKEKERTVFFFKRENGIEEIISKLVYQLKARK